MLHLGVKELRHGGTRTVNAVQRPQQRRLVVKRLAAVGDKYGGDAQRIVVDKCRRGDIPGRIAACLEGVADAAVGEARCVGLLLHQHLAVKLLNHAVLAVVFDKRVMFLGGAVGQWVEPVGIVCHPVVQRPLLHRLGDIVCQLAVQRCLLVDSTRHSLVGITRQILKHLLAVKDLLSIIAAGRITRDVHLYRSTVESNLHFLKSQM